MAIDGLWLGTKQCIEAFNAEFLFLFIQFYQVPTSLCAHRLLVLHIVCTSGKTIQ